LIDPLFTASHHKFLDLRIKSCAAAIGSAETLSLLPSAAAFTTGIKNGLYSGKLSSVRAKVEHPFRVVKRQFGYIKTRYRGLKKNAAQVFTLFALANLYRVRCALLA
jgi:hypothetical protein